MAIELDEKDEDSVLRPIRAAGSRSTHDPELIALGELIDMINDSIGGGVQRQQIVNWLDVLLEKLRGNEQLREQAAANSEGQFLTSKELRTNVLLAVVETQQAQDAMTEAFDINDDLAKRMTEKLGHVLYSQLRS